MENHKAKTQDTDAADTDTANINDTKNGTNEVEKQKKADDLLTEQKRKDLLLEQERMRKWIEEDEPPPVKMSCKLSQHIVAKDTKKD